MKTTKNKDDQKQRQPKTKTTKNEDNQKLRQPKTKTTNNEDDQIRRQPKTKMTKKRKRPKKEDDQQICSKLGGKIQKVLIYVLFNIKKFLILKASKLGG